MGGACRSGRLPDRCTGQHAQSPLGIGTAEPSFQPTGGPLAPLFLYVNYEQQAFYRALTGALKAMPAWRIQAAGAEDLIAVRKEGHPGPGTVTRWRADPVPDGFVFEFEERWNSEGQQW